eukprot:7726335-Alexandrium_andersonii.AAC.1
MRAAHQDTRAGKMIQNIPDKSTCMIETKQKTSDHSLAFVTNRGSELPGKEGRGARGRATWNF